jgi:hypothetical protein
MNAVRLGHLCDRLLVMLEDGPREDSQMLREAHDIREELVAAKWSAGANVPAISVNAQVVGFARTAIDGFERWFGPQPLEGEADDQSASDLEHEIRRAITSLRGVAGEHLPKHPK